MNLTLLDTVNYCLDYMDGFGVSTLDDTVESQQITRIAEKVFYDVVEDVFPDEKLSSLEQLESLADSEKPNYLKLPDDVSKIAEAVLFYDMENVTSGQIDQKEVQYLPPIDFLQYVQGRKINDDSRAVTDFGGYRFVILTNRDPSVYTSFDDKHIVFDSYNSADEDTVQGYKSGIMTKRRRTWTTAVDYEIDLPEWFQPTYLNAVIAEVSVVLKEEPNFMAAKKARSGIIKARKKQRVGTPNKHRRNYGRW